MAKPNVFLLLSILLLAPLSSISQSITLPPAINLGEINIRGDLRCSLTGDSDAPPVSGGTVALVCGSSNTTLAETLTNPDGTFTLVLNFARAILLDPAICGVVAYLPGGNCTIAPPDGTLTASIDLVRVIYTGALAIFEYVTGAFLDQTV